MEDEEQNMGLVGLLHSLAVRAALTNISINAVCPAFVATNIGP